MTTWLLWLVPLALVQPLLIWGGRRLQDHVGTRQMDALTTNQRISGLPDELLARWAARGRPGLGVPVFVGVVVACALAWLSTLAPHELADWSRLVRAGDAMTVGALVGTPVVLALLMFSWARAKLAEPAIVVALRDRADRVVWAYATQVLVVTANGLSEHRAQHHELTLVMDDGTTFDHLPLVSPEVPVALAAIAARSPRAVIGYSPEAHRRFRPWHARMVGTHARK